MKIYTQQIIPVFIALWSIANCATITTGQDQVISVNTPNCPAASCSLTNSEGTYYINKTPGTVTINKSGSNLNILCSIDGGDEEAISSASHTEGMTWGNILVGGIIGYAVDAGTGSAYEPSLISHPLDCRDEMPARRYKSGGAKLRNSAQTESGSADIEEQLIELKKLYDDGLISEDLYARKQEAILQN
jgi:hypothetical protein